MLNKKYFFKIKIKMNESIQNQNNILNKTLKKKNYYTTSFMKL